MSDFVYNTMRKAMEELMMDAKRSPFNRAEERHVAYSPDEIDIADVTVDWQRNGMSGEGFWFGTFTHRPSGSDTGYDMAYVVFDNDEEIVTLAHGAQKHNPRCAIINMDDPTEHYRGDNFAKRIYPYIEEHMREMRGLNPDEPTIRNVPGPSAAERAAVDQSIWTQTAKERVTRTPEDGIISIENISNDINTIEAVRKLQEG